MSATDAEAFETDYPLQDDLLFDIPRGYDAPFEQVDVTDEYIHQ